MSSKDFLNNTNLQHWEILDSHEVFAAKQWIKVFQQQVRLPNGTVISDYHQIALGEFAVVFAQIADGSVIVERQYKHGSRKVSLVMPAGSIEPGEEPMFAAQRELLEETGYGSDSWESVGEFIGNGNYGCGKAHLFVAKDACKVQEPDSGDLEEMEIVLMKPSELTNALLDGQFHMLGSVAMIALMLLRLANNR